MPTITRERFNPKPAEKLRNAKFAPLKMVPTTPSATQVEDELYRSTVEAEERLSPRQRRRNKRASENLKSTISAFFADLVLSSGHRDSDGWCYRQHDPRSFTDTRAKSRQFQKVAYLWNALGLLEIGRGFQVRIDFTDGPTSGPQRWATRYRATDELLNIAHRHGITAENVGENFARDKVKGFPVVLKAQKRGRGSKEGGRRMGFDRNDPNVAALADEIREINAFLAQHEYSFGEPPYLERVFNNGDVDAFNWDQGGRLVDRSSVQLQTMKKDLRGLIRIDGSPTIEMDFQSSQLTLAYALAGRALPAGDPYHVPDIPRLIAKRILVAYLGKGAPPTQWPQGLAAEYEEETGRFLTRDFKLKAVVAKVEAKHPIIEHIAAKGIGPGRLQNVESRILVAAMLQLIRQYQIPSLPIYDCLIVKLEDQLFAEDAMKDAFFCEVAANPVIKAKSIGPP